MLLLVAGLTTAFAFERILHVFVVLMQPSSYKTLAAMQVLGGLVTNSGQLAASAASLGLSAASVLFQWLLASAVLMLVAGVVWLICSSGADLMFELGRIWNSGLGASLQVTLVWPARLVARLSDALVPLWNAWWWLVMKLPSQVLVQTITKDLATLENIFVALVAMAKASAGSLVAWFTSFGACVICSPDTCGSTCLDTGPRVLDLITPMASVRNIAMWLTAWARDLCAVMAGPLEMATYPFMDINLAYGLHWLANAALWATVQMPAVTLERCMAYGSESPVMCVPDFEPVFTMTATGLRALGTMLDNWLDVSVLIVQATLGSSLPTCTQLPDLLRNLDFRANSFGANTTIMVGMTPSMFARTDGVGIQVRWRPDLVVQPVDLP